MLQYWSVLGALPLTFLLFTCGLCGWFAYIVGRSCAFKWRPMWVVVPYTTFLAGGERFFNWALFNGDLVSLSGFLIDALTLIFVALISYWVTLSLRKATQYPWRA